MSVKVEYLEKYSVAPPPSRDYYGIKVLRDEVILFIWKISHGPHRAPTIRVTKFSEFDDDKTLQDEIQRVFGNYLLNHVKNIARNEKDSILTLPKNVIARISKYLRFKDVINLTTLSRASKEVFDNEIVWETLYRKYKRSRISKEEKKHAMASSWKQLLKERQLQESIKNHKSKEDKPKNFHRTVKERPPINLAVNSRNQNSSTFSKKLTEDSKKLVNTEPLLRLKTLSKIASEKEKLDLKSTTSMAKITDAKKVLPTNKLKTDLKEKELTRSQLTINKNISQKINSLTKPKSSICLKSIEDLKTRTSSRISLETRKSTPSLKNQKLVSEKLKIDSKTQKKEVKPKKLGESKSTILNSDKTLFDDFHVDDISSLIEESLKNFKSPRSIFNYDFSILNDKKSAGDSKIISPISETQILKKDFTHLEGPKSESQSDDDEKLDTAHFTQKYLTARTEFMKKMAEASNLSTPKTPGSKNPAVDGKFPKSLRTIQENLKKTRASIFAAKGMESKNISQEKSRMPSTKGSNFLKK